MMLYDSVYRQVISLSSQVACCFSTERMCGWPRLSLPALPDVLFHLNFQLDFAIAKTGTVCITYIEEELFQLKKHHAPSFSCTHQIQWKKH